MKVIYRVLPFLLLLISSNLRAEDRPNIVFILADDLGVECLGSYGGTSYRTPHLDQLAAEGLRFTHAYSQPLCTNTRIQLMTGKYNNRNWKYFGILDPAEKTFGHLLQEAGYRTMIAGKWQLQSYDPPEYPGASLRRGTGMNVQAAGFDEYSLWHTGHTEDKGSRYADPRINKNGTFRSDTKGKYGPDLWVADINDFLQRNKNSDQPFFVYYSMALPHWPMVPTPQSQAWSDPKRRDEEDTRYFRDMVEYMDGCVGEIVRQVDQLGLADSTMIVFYSDNGTHLKITSQTKNGAVSGGKGMTTNAGTHVPLIVRWTGTVQPGLNSDLVDSTDFLPTFLDAAQQDLPDTPELDGISFYPQLQGRSSEPRPWVFCHYDPRPGWDKDQFQLIRFARDKQYKLYGDGRFYDCLNDPLEQIPLNEPGITSDVKAALQRVLDEMPKPECAPRDHLHFQPTQQSGFLSSTAKLELLWSDGVFTEGPTIATDGSVLFTDIPRQRIMRFDPSSGVTRVYRENSGRANGLAFDGRGRLLACEGGGEDGGRRVSITSSDGSVSTLVDHFQGKRFNSPNDVAITPNGTTYFTDPRYGDQSDRELEHEGVYYVKQGQAHLATHEVERPNGIVFSPDGKTAYVADNNNQYGGARTLLAFAVQDDGSFRSRRVLFDFGMGRRGIDGMAIDDQGNIYATAGKGVDAAVYVFGPQGEHLASIPVPDAPTNCVLHPETQMLYVTAQVQRDRPGKYGLFRISLQQ